MEGWEDLKVCSGLKFIPCTILRGYTVAERRDLSSGHRMFVAFDWMRDVLRAYVIEQYGLEIYLGLHRKNYDSRRIHMHSSSLKLAKAVTCALLP